jgi:outer membrane lipoprotein-sorting protein
MARTTPWILAAVCLVGGGGLWIYRARRSEAHAPPPGPALVERAWLEGRRVALRGHQEISMTDARDRPVTVAADVLYSRDGRMRIDYLSEPLEGVKVWESGDRTYRYNPRRKRLSVALRQGSPDEQARAELALLQKNYTAEVTGAEPIAGRPAWVVSLLPRTATDRWKRLWIDQQTGVVLRNEDLQGKSGFVRRTTFTQVELLSPEAELPAEEFRPPQSLVERYAEAVAGDASSRFEDTAALGRLVGFPLRRPAALPAGYVFEGAYQIPCICGRNHQAVRMEYSDGLNRVSLFQAGHPECTATRGGFAGGSPLAEQLTREGVYYWAVGALPRPELRKLIRSAAGSEGGAADPAS